MKGLFTKVLAGLGGTTGVAQFVQAYLGRRLVLCDHSGATGAGWQWYPKRGPRSHPVGRDSDLWSASKEEPGGKNTPTSLSSFPPISC